MTGFRIIEALVEYITNDGGLSFSLKNVSCLKMEKKKEVVTMGSELPRHKEIPVEKYINLQE